MLATVSATALLGLSGCSASADHAPAASTTGPTQSTTSPASAPPSTASPPGPAKRTPSATGTPGPTVTTLGRAACVASIVGRLTPAQRAGQLVWAGLASDDGSRDIDALVRSDHLGGIVLLGGWSGSAEVAATTRHLQSLTSAAATGRLALLVSADQEGGAVQELTGPGFSAIPSALSQGSMSPSALTAAATTWGTQLHLTGVDLDLAPVADTVPASLGTQNAPIGRYHREFSADPERNASMVAAFVAGLHDAGVAATVKHFPGLGRITGNTDVTAHGITDPTATTHDPYLAPFAAGIAAGVDVVMVGSAFYPGIDPAHQAVFSSAVITGLLRGTMRYGGVVVSDEIGAAAAVAAVPLGERAADVIAAGGDAVIVKPHADVAPMVAGLLQRARSDPGFSARLDQAATRVVELKVRRGLAGCG